mgnify:CR=1 FL=1
MNIVLIDDDQLVCMSLKMILEANEGIHVTAIGKDGSDALPLYREFHPDILLMDIQMVRLRAKRILPVLKWLKWLLKRWQTKIVLMQSNKR